jgi:hypothetical protein
MTRIGGTMTVTQSDHRSAGLVVVRTCKDRNDPVLLVTPPNGRPADPEFNFAIKASGDEVYVALAEQALVPAHRGDL